MRKGGVEELRDCVIIGSRHKEIEGGRRVGRGREGGRRVGRGREGGRNSDSEGASEGGQEERRERRWMAGTEG